MEPKQEIFSASPEVIRQGEECQYVFGTIVQKGNGMEGFPGPVQCRRGWWGTEGQVMQLGAS